MRPINPVLIPDNTLEAAFSNPNGPMNMLSQFVFYSKYSRWRDDVKRREYWAETTQRSTEYNVNLGVAYLEQKGLMTPELRDFHEKELLELFDNQFNLRQALSGRTLWTGGTEASHLYPMSNFNCSFMVIDHWHKFAELCYLGMVGAGIGFRVLMDDVDKLDRIVNEQWEIEHKPIGARPEESKTAHTTYTTANGQAAIMIGDSKEGWCDAIRALFNILTGQHGKVDKITFIYDNIRPAGARIKVFGGTAGGPGPLREMFNKIHTILHGELTPDYPKVVDGKIRPVMALDIGNVIADNIVSGGVRSFAEIGLGDPDDQEFIQAKNGHWNYPQLSHRNTSNNSVFYQSRPSDEQLDWQFDALRFGGEPCFVNAEVARLRRKDFEGVNPCVEILLADRGMCNLTTVNWLAFVKGGKFDYSGLFRAQAIAARCGMRMTLPTMELPEWDLVQQRDRLLGVSGTGVMDAFDAVGYTKEQQSKLLREMKRIARTAADEYADLLGVNRSLLVTTIKPEGTQSQLFGGVSSGLHVSHDSNYIRRVRVQTVHPMARTVFDLGWRMHADSNDGSWHRQVMDLVQYMDMIKQDSVRVSEYTLGRGYLMVEFDCVTFSPMLLAGDELPGQFQRMADTYFTGKLVSHHIEVGDSAGDSGMNAKVKYVVKGLTFDEAFGKSKKITVDFPVQAPAKKTKYNTSAIEQLETYRMFLHDYVEHNASNTVSVFPHEWDGVKQWVKDNWDDMLAVSFLGMSDSYYPQQPYESCDENEIEVLRDMMAPFDPLILAKYDRGQEVEEDGPDCKDGACAVR